MGPKFKAFCDHSLLSRPHLLPLFKYTSVPAVPNHCGCVFCYPCACAHVVLSACYLSSPHLVTCGLPFEKQYRKYYLKRVCQPPPPKPNRSSIPPRVSHAALHIALIITLSTFYYNYVIIDLPILPVCGRFLSQVPRGGDLVFILFAAPGLHPGPGSW